MYGEGISLFGCLLDIALELNIIEKSGSWFSYNGNKIGQGRDNVIVYLKANPELADEIEKLIREKMV
jgi:recombination protein RecA